MIHGENAMWKHRGSGGKTAVRRWRQRLAMLPSCSPCLGFSEAGIGKEGSSPIAFRRSMADALMLTFRPQSWESTHLCWLSSLLVVLYYSRPSKWMLRKTIRWFLSISEWEKQALGQGGWEKIWFLTSMHFGSRADKNLLITGLQREELVGQRIPFQGSLRPISVWNS